MCREALIPHLDSRDKYYARYIRNGKSRSNNHKKTILVRDVYDSHGNYITDHAWIIKNDDLNRVSDKLFENAEISFDAECYKYRKRSRAYDYGLGNLKHTGIVIAYRPSRCLMV